MKNFTLTTLKVTCACALLGLAILGCNPHFDPTPEPYGTPDPPPKGEALPVISSVTPTKALPGSVITITGFNFNTVLSANTATIAGVPAVVNSVSVNEVLVTVPASFVTGTTGPIVLKSGNTTLTSVNNFTATGGTVTGFTSFAPTTIKRMLVNRLGNLYGITNDAVLQTLLGGVGTVFASGFNSLTDIATQENETGELYVADSLARKIYRVSNLGQVNVFAGEGKLGYNDGTTGSAQFARPTALAFDPSGNLYVADEYRVRKITGNGLVSTVAGSPSFADVNGTGEAARFGKLTSIAIDQKGNIFVADNQYKKIRKITPAGVVTTLAGSGATGFTDGSPASASFTSLGGMAIDAAGNIFIADIDAVTSTYKIRMINKVGVVSTLLTGSSNTTVSNGPLATATVSKPNGLSIDVFGNLYISNAGSRTVNKVAFQ